MTISTIDLIMGRIESATPESQIAVYRLNERQAEEASVYKKPALRSVFANTLHQIDKRNKGEEGGLLIGYFDNTMNKERILASLEERAVGGESALEALEDLKAVANG